MALAEDKLTDWQVSVQLGTQQVTPSRQVCVASEK